MRFDKIVFFFLLKCLMTSEILTNECRNDWNIPYLANFIKWWKSILISNDDEIFQLFDDQEFGEKNKDRKKNENRMQQQSIQHKKNNCWIWRSASLFANALIFAHFFPCLSLLLSSSSSFFDTSKYKFFFLLHVTVSTEKKTHTQMNHSKQPNEIVQFVI